MKTSGQGTIDPSHRRAMIGNGEPLMDFVTKGCERGAGASGAIHITIHVSYTGPSIVGTGMNIPVVSLVRVTDHHGLTRGRQPHKDVSRGFILGHPATVLELQGESVQCPVHVAAVHIAKPCS